MSATLFQLEAHAPAKINLSLEVLGRRSDGYHDLVSVMQTVGLYDRLTVHPANILSLSCDALELAGEDNLALRAGQLLRDRFPGNIGGKLFLSKVIPVAAGLGGGSSDAAAALVSLSRLWNLRASCVDLQTLAAELGSDVPYFLYGGTALIQGRGERVTALPSPPTAHYVLTTPPTPVSTARIFEELPSDAWTDGKTTLGLAASIRRGEPVKVGRNALEQTLFQLYPTVRDCFEAVVALAPGRTIVSGSGGTIAALFPSQAAARHAAKSLEERGYHVVAVPSTTPPDWQTPCR